MKIRTLLILIFGFGIGFGEKFAYDAYQEHEQQRILEEVQSSGSCSMCSERKADMQQQRAYNAERALSEEQADTDNE